MIRSAFAKFAAFARHPDKDLKPAHTLLAVTPELAIAFFQSIKDNFAWETLKKFSIVLSGAFTRFAPFGVANPFDGARMNAVGRKTAEDEKTVHHRPLDRSELRKVWSEANKDSDKTIYNLAVTSASTGLRIGDCCCLKWADIDLKGGFITTTAAKTGALLTVPIFDYDPASPNYEPDLGEFRRILETALAESEKDEPYVFPSAATAYLHEEVEIVNGQKIMLQSDRDKNEVASLYGKAVENARRIALTIAVGKNNVDPIIGAEDMRYGVALVSHTIRYAIDAIEENLAENELERAKKRLLKTIREAGSHGIVRKDLTRKSQYLKRQLRDECLDDLIEAGEIIIGKTDNGAELFKIA